MLSKYQLSCKLSLQKIFIRSLSNHRIGNINYQFQLSYQLCHTMKHLFLKLISFLTNVRLWLNDEQFF